MRDEEMQPRAAEKREGEQEEEIGTEVLLHFKAHHHFNPSGLLPEVRNFKKSNSVVRIIYTVPHRPWDYLDLSFPILFLNKFDCLSMSTFH